MESFNFIGKWLSDAPKLIIHGHYLMMELFDKQNKTEEAKTIAEDIIAMETKVDSDAVKEIRLRANAVLLGDVFKDNTNSIIEIKNN